MMTLRLGKHFLKSNQAKLRRNYSASRGLLDYDNFELSFIARLLDCDCL